MFKNPLKADVTVKHVIELPDTEAFNAKLNQFKRDTRKTLLYVGVGVAGIVTLAFALHVASEVAINELTTPDL